jgi:hypothetical protein
MKRKRYDLSVGNLDEAITSTLSAISASGMPALSRVLQKIRSLSRICCAGRSMRPPRRKWRTSCETTTASLPNSPTLRTCAAPLPAERARTLLRDHARATCGFALGARVHLQVRVHFGFRDGEERRTPNLGATIPITLEQVARPSLRARSATLPSVGATDPLFPPVPCSVTSGLAPARQRSSAV